VQLATVDLLEEQPRPQRHSGTPGGPEEQVSSGSVLRVRKAEGDAGLMK
jgi:hypothetical protein